MVRSSRRGGLRHPGSLPPVVFCLDPASGTHQAGLQRRPLHRWRPSSCAHDFLGQCTAGSGGTCRLEQLARLLAEEASARRRSSCCGIIELVRGNDFRNEQSRSPALCEAAIHEVAQDARRRDFRDAVPNPRHRLWIWMVAVPMVTALSLFALFPAAAANAWQRFLLPWKNAPRYTFTMLEPLSKTIVVPHGESFSIAPKLTRRATRSWHPRQGSTSPTRNGFNIRSSPPLRDRRYYFELPPPDRLGLAGHAQDLATRWSTLRIEADLAPRTDLGRRVGHTP